MKIAVIGAIATGKSTIGQMLREMGKRVLDCDRLYDEVCAQSDYIASIERTFGAVRDGRIDRKALGDIVFGDPRRLAQLNALAHPRIKELLRARTAGDGDWYVEVSVYVGSGLEGFFDRVICAHCPIETRVQRLASRGLTREQALRRIVAQTPQETLIALADDLIDTSASKETTRARLKEIVQTVDNRAQS